MIDLETLRVRIYHSFAEEGRVGTAEELAADLGATPDEVRQGIRELAEHRHLALDAEGRIALAHPFATRDFGFSVKSADTLWWGGCAWDAFSIPNLVPGASPSLVATTCPACGRAHAWVVDDEAPPEGDQVAHFLVPVAHVWDDVIHTCSHQRIFCDERCVDDWLARTGNARGSVFGLDRLWNLASDWYSGRLERGYTRREPAEVGAYFRGAGLTGAFWGN
ncbi:organomercurial lyase [Agromyces mangrovi Wang et al. 2018]|uniref:organomercurial lyase n=1 Tax=Agromyces mangrovi TaxID=1858653 RepID=UPI0025724BBF|nr:organomercurial lyase [Agromyces mangrovi]BDZ65614.1 membrane protein [Agromyces mangrovi]